MDIVNNKEEVPFAHYEELFEKADPEEITRRCGVPFDGTAFTVEFSGNTYSVTHPKFSISSPNKDAFALYSKQAQTFILRFLIEAEKRPFLGAFKTFREMPWGELYIEPFTGRCIKRSAFTFGTRISAFSKALDDMGAKKLTYADASYEIEVLPGYYLQFLVWEGDDEFPPNCQILYSDNFEDGFAAEDRVVVAELLINIMKSAMKG